LLKKTAPGETSPSLPFAAMAEAGQAPVAQVVAVSGPFQPPAEPSLEAYEPFSDKRYDVTNTIESLCGLIWCPCAGWTTKTLTLEDQEVKLREKNCLLNRVQKRPYAQLGSVDKVRNNGCCVAFVSDFAPVNEKGEGGIAPGFGCEEALVDEIVSELQARKLKRGSVAQIRKLEYLASKVARIATQVPLVMHKMELPFAPREAPDAEKKKEFPTKAYDVSNYIAMLCGCTTQELVLEKEEAVLTTNQCLGCNSVRQKREYSELGSVQAVKSCFCCRAVASDIGGLAPGFGCSGSVVTQIVDDLRERMNARGDIGQIQKQEKLLKGLAPVMSELAAIGRGGGNPPSQEQMSGESMEKVMADYVQAVDDREFDITNHIQSCMTCLCTLGIAGCTRETLELKAEEVVVKSVNNIDDTHLRMPYGNMGSVDVDRSCCCCFGVNSMSPGFGCNRQLTQQIADELQLRKEKRGNIAQLRQLQLLTKITSQLQAQADTVLQKEGIAYPPDPETVRRVFGDNPPRVLTGQADPHPDPTEEFGPKDWDITDNVESLCALCCSCCLAGWTTKTMKIGGDEMHITATNWCCESNTRVPYAQLGSVETEESCFCCSELPEVARPGWGCSRDRVDEIAKELQQRKVKRGNIAQILTQENLITDIMKLSAKLDLLVDRRGVEYPPSQETMQKVFKPQ